MKFRQVITAVLVTTLLVAAGAPAVAATGDNADAPDGVDVDATQRTDTGNVTVSVTENGTAAANVTVVVNASGNYTSEGTHVTDANGTVELAAPGERVTANVTATADGAARTETFEFVPLSESLSVDVTEDGDGSVTATVTQYGTPVENATVEVNASGNYTGEGTYATDADGTISLDEPAEAVTVSLTATTGTLSAETSVELAPTDVRVRVAQNNDSVTVTVTRNGTAVENASVAVESDDGYADVGTYATDVNGTVDLSAPDRPVVVTVTATDGDDAATTVVTLERPADPEANDFARKLGAFIEQLRGNGLTGFGPEIAQFVQKHNPASADDREASDRGAADDAANESERGSSDRAGPSDRGSERKNGSSAERGGASPQERGSSDGRERSNADDDSGGNDERKGGGNGEARGRGN